MTWTRLKRWIGDHPVAALAGGTVLWFAPMSLAVCAVNAVDGAGKLDRAPMLWVTLVYLGLSPFVLTGLSCVVGWLRGSTLRPVPHPLRSLLWVWAGLSVLALPVYFAAQPYERAVLTAALALPICVAAGLFVSCLTAYFVVLGHWLAWGATRRRLVRGGAAAGLAAPLPDPTGNGATGDRDEREDTRAERTEGADGTGQTEKGDAEP